MRSHGGRPRHARGPCVPLSPPPVPPSRARSDEGQTCTEDCDEDCNGQCDAGCNGDCDHVRKYTECDERKWNGMCQHETEHSACNGFDHEDRNDGPCNQGTVCASCDDNGDGPKGDCDGPITCKGDCDHYCDHECDHDCNSGCDGCNAHTQACDDSCDSGCTCPAGQFGAAKHRGGTTTATPSPNPNPRS